jgi:hypothetical protein
VRNKNLSIMRSIAPDPADAPATGWVGSIVTVVAGRGMGEVIRSIGDQPGPRTVTHEAHIAIDGHDTGGRCVPRRRTGQRAGPPDRDRCRYRPPSSGVSATEEG